MKPSCSSGWQRSLTYGLCSLPLLCSASQQIPRSSCLKACTRAGRTFMAKRVFLRSKIPFSFSWLDVPLFSFLYLYCHCLDFVFNLISSVNDRTKFEKPKVLQFIIISFVFSLTLSPSTDHRISLCTHIFLCSLLSCIQTTGPCF